MTDQRTRLDVTRNRDVIAAAAKALWHAKERAEWLGDPYLTEVLTDVSGMLFIDVDDDAAEEQEREQELLDAQAFVEEYGWPGEVEG